MPKEEWGTKRMCPHCGSRFYDLQHDPMTCPVCGTEFTAESLIAGRGRALVAEKTAARGTTRDVIDADEDIETVDADGELDDDLLEDDDDDADVSLDEIADVASEDEES